MAAKKQAPTPSRIRVKVSDRDLGWSAFVQTVHAFVQTRPDVVTGIFGPENQQKRPGKADAKELAAHKRRERSRAKSQKNYQNRWKPPPVIKGTGPSNVELAQIHEFGLGKHIPKRSFLRSTFDINREGYRRYLVLGVRRELYVAVKKRTPISPMTSLTMKRLALKMEGDVKKRIGQRQITPPNAPSTIRQKKSSTPLIDTGQLRRSVTSAIRTGGSR